MEKPVVFQSSGQQIVGMLHVPDRRKGRVPAVVLFHGFTGNKSEIHRIFVKTARALCAAGFAALRFDFRGSGDSDGDFSEMTVTGELKDARAALRFVRTLSAIDPSRVGVLGFSLGGLIAATMLGEDLRIKVGVLWCPVARLDRQSRRRMSAASWKQLRETGVLDLGGNAVGRAFFDEGHKHHPLECIRKTRASILLVHGDQDTGVPLSASDEYEAVLKKEGRDVVKHVLPGADHTFSSIAWEKKVIGLSLEWFRSYLR